MEVRSSLTGSRGVCLPFTDFCNTLQRDAGATGPLYNQAMAYGRQRGWRYLECRSNDRDWKGAIPSLEFYGHVIDLSQGAEALFKRFKGSVRRCIRRAENSGLKLDFDTNEEAMQNFYRLHCLTRRRHGAPPQPKRFFENIAQHVLGENHGFIATARADGQAIASAVFFHFGREASFKFGASDHSFQRLRPNDEIMWAAIKRLAAQGLDFLHLGRTSVGNEGLRRFKLGFATHEEKIEYYKYDFRKSAFVTDVDWTQKWVSNVFRCLPPGLSRLAGNILYQHYL
jgi:hypothetical protein